MPWGQERVPEGVALAAAASLELELRNWRQLGRGQADTCACVLVLVRARASALERGGEKSPLSRAVPLLPQFEANQILIP